MIRTTLNPLLRALGVGSSLADARFDFADSLADVIAPQVEHIVGRINQARSLHELWNFRGEIFGLVARQHHEGEARRRLDSLARHAPGRRRQPTSFAVDTGHAPF